jgi:thiazolylpeptide-type bacteriocin precursor
MFDTAHHFEIDTFEVEEVVSNNTSQLSGCSDTVCSCSYACCTSCNCPTTG